MIRIEIYADVVCPWCRIGEARLNRALQQFPDETFQLVWKPFQLQPQMPLHGRSWERFIQEKFGGSKQASSMFARVAQIGSVEGIVFNFEQIASAPNTTDAHRLILLASEHDLTWTMAHTLYKAYFEDGDNLNDYETLLRLAEAGGLSRKQSANLLTSDAFKDDVARSQTLAHQMGITGVPFFIFGQRYAVSGAQPVELFIEAIQTTQNETLTNSS